MAKYVTDRWQRELRSGVKGFASLWLDENNEWHFEVKFRFPPDAPHQPEIGEIADELMEVLNKREAPLSMFLWERKEEWEWALGSEENE